MRIIGGTLGGRRLLAPRGLDTRPTSDRVKEALFNILGAPVREGERPFRALDLFAGSGALGLEALSRGADEAVLVEQDRRAIAAARRNVADLGLEGRARIVEADVGEALRRMGGLFSWVFVDPPYGTGALDRALRLLGSRPILEEGGLVLAEHDSRDPPAERHGALALRDRRRWGQTAISFYTIAPDGETR